MNSFFRILITASLLLFLSGSAASAQATALPNAHAHNDYKHRHPLQDAMACGFTSIEADVFLKRNKFIVAHVSPFLKKANLEELYLQPLSELVKQHPGCVYKGYSEPMILLIDIKTDAAKAYAALKPLLEKYASILTRCENGKVIKGAVTIVLSGHKPYDLVKAELSRFAFIDESLLSAGDKKEDQNVCPLTSANYSKVLKWKGKGKMSGAEKQKLMAYTSAAHAQGKKVRLWASPENKAVWQELLNCGVDLINTDDLVGLRDFLMK